MALVQDDIMDCSETRRGRPAWYKVDGIGLFAFNDSMMFFTGIFLLLKKHFADRDFYRYAYELINEMVFYTALGQSLDATTIGYNVYDFTLEKYLAISKYKTFYYTFYLPMALGMRMAG